MQTVEQGHFTLEIDNKKYNLTPSFKNMARLANADRLIIFFDLIHGNIADLATKINVAREILIACSDDESIDKYLIKCKKNKPHVKPSSISINDQIIVAAALMRHGIAGVNAPKYENSGKKGKPLTKFDVYQYVADAKNHFGLTLDEAWNLTMTEFRYHLASKFPPIKDKDSAPDIKEHEQSMKDPKVQEMYKKAIEHMRRKNGK
jgi:hypothetical protein